MKYLIIIFYTQAYIEILNSLNFISSKYLILKINLVNNIIDYWLDLITKIL